MWVAAIAWDTEGFEVACVHRDGRTRPPLRVEANDKERIFAHVIELAGAHPDDDVVAVVESTNGILDGPLLSAGLRVFRADPWVLPPRPPRASVGAGDLATHALRHLSDLVPLDEESGTLRGRLEELDENIERSTPVARELARRGLFVERVMSAAPRIALTFDDGPNPPYTDRILDVLAAYDITATFFCVGLNAAAHPETLARIADAGHTLSNHTWSHPFLPDLSQDELRFQLNATNEVIRNAAGVAPRLVRPPYGSRTPEVLNWIAEQGMSTVLWDNDTCDWAMPGAESITAKAVQQAGNGSIMLMHDGGGDRSQTVEALPRVIDTLHADGFEFAGLEQLLPSSSSA